MLTSAAQKVGDLNVVRELFPFQEETVNRLKDQRGILIGHDMRPGTRKNCYCYCN